MAVASSHSARPRAHNDQLNAVARRDARAVAWPSVRPRDWLPEQKYGRDSLLRFVRRRRHHCGLRKPTTTAPAAEAGIAFHCRAQPRPDRIAWQRLRQRKLLSHCLVVGHFEPQEVFELVRAANWFSGDVRQNESSQAGRSFFMRRAESPVTAGVAPAQTKFLQDLALFAHALMLKASPDRFDHRSGSACRLRL
jgi:hypothetical protein